MGNNGSKDNNVNGDLINLHDWEIRRVNNGLEEAKVVAIIDGLISQRDKLIKRTDHLSSLQRLAEKTIEDADELARQLETEATHRAEAEAAAIVGKAEEQAQNLKNENKKIQLELKNTVDKLCTQLISEPESFTQRIMALQTEADHRLTQLVEHADPATAETHEINDDSPESPELVEQAEPHKIHVDPPSTSIMGEWRDTSWR